MILEAIATNVMADVRAATMVAVTMRVIATTVQPEGLPLVTTGARTPSMPVTEIYRINDTNSRLC